MKKDTQHIKYGKIFQRSTGKKLRWSDLKRFEVFRTTERQKSFWPSAIFTQDSATTHTNNLVQDFLKETIPRSYIKKDQWPPKLPGSNPLVYYFWNKVKTKVYEDRLNTPFESEEDTISKIKPVWKECASNLAEIGKFILPSGKSRDQSKHQHAKMLPYWIGGKHMAFFRGGKLRKLIRYSSSRSFWPTWYQITYFNQR